MRAQGELLMTYSLFCTTVSTQSETIPDPSRVVTVNSDSMGAAISEAIKLIGDGVIVWKIEGSEGFVMERSDIETERLRRQENMGKRTECDERTTSEVVRRARGNGRSGERETLSHG
jgi:hypothetical protein